MLKPGVAFAPTNSGAVLLDLHLDQFVVLNHTSAAIWTGLSAGLTESQIADRLGASSSPLRTNAREVVSRQVAQWFEQRLLVNAAPASVVPRQKPASAAAAAPEMDPGLLAGRWPSLSMMCLLAAKTRHFEIRLHTDGLAPTLASYQAATNVANRCSAATLASLVRSYRAVRGLFREADDVVDCLPRSLALGSTLRRLGFEVDLCIGVIDLPFSAHAWIECNAALVSDRFARCERYQVIVRL